MKSSFYRRLGPKGRASVLVGGVLAGFLVLCLCGAGLVGLFGDGPAGKATQTTDNTGLAGDEVSGVRVGSSASTMVSPPTPTQPAAPVVETKTVTETQPIAFTEKTVNDSSLAKGTRQTRTAGVNGSKTLTYEVTYTNGVETGRKLVNEVVTQQPVNQLTAVGTKVAAQPPAPPVSTCDPNYSGCVPIASDVDCLPGKGNGPAYISEPVQVIGTDIYDLDSDQDGVACEKD